MIAGNEERIIIAAAKIRAVAALLMGNGERSDIVMCEALEAITDYTKIIEGLVISTEQPN